MAEEVADNPRDSSDRIHRAGRYRLRKPAVAAALAGLERGAVTDACRDCAAGLAALIAAEQTLLVVASILPV